MKLLVVILVFRLSPSSQIVVTRVKSGQKCRENTNPSIFFQINILSATGKAFEKIALIALLLF